MCSARVLGIWVCLLLTLSAAACLRRPQCCTCYWHYRTVLPQCNAVSERPSSPSHFSPLIPVQRSWPGFSTLIRHSCRGKTNRSFFGDENWLRGVCWTDDQCIHFQPSATCWNFRLGSGFDDVVPPQGPSAEPYVYLIYTNMCKYKCINI